MVKIEYYFNKGIEHLILAASIAVYAVGILGGIGIIIFQIYAYLKHGTWIPFSINLPISMINENLNSWVSYPTSWQGLYKVLEIIPLSIALILIGIILGTFLLFLHFNYKNDNEVIFKS